jgi:hypothetical protein
MWKENYPNRHYQHTTSNILGQVHSQLYPSHLQSQHRKSQKRVLSIMYQSHLPAQHRKSQKRVLSVVYQIHLPAQHRKGQQWVAGIKYQPTVFFSTTPFKALAAISNINDPVRDLNTPLLGMQSAAVRSTSPESPACALHSISVDGVEYGRGIGNRESQAIECAAQVAYLAYSTHG